MVLKRSLYLLNIGMKAYSQSRLFPVMIRTLRNLLCALALLLMISQTGFAEVRLPRLISNGMILQRETPLKIWGWANAGETVILQFNNKSFESVTAAKGSWQITLPPQKAGGPFEFKISGKNTIILNNILFGDVWLCSGQSNMEYPLNRLTDKYAPEIASSDNNFIRQFKVPQAYYFNTPLDDYPNGKWMSVNPKTILEFSAVAYFFARELYAKYKIPIGIINASLGGSPAEAWMSTEGLKEFPHYLAEAEKFKDQSAIGEIQSRERKASSDWYNLLNQTDNGLKSIPSWKDPAFDASAWPEIPVPSYWADHGQGEVNGAVWFRKEIALPASMTGKPVRLFLGRIVDADSVFINGIFVGTTAYQYPQRRYTIPEGVLRSGKNTIIIRVISNSGRGGFVNDKPYKLFAGNDTIELCGIWQFQVGCVMNPTPSQTFVQWKPTGLYNGMLAPSNNYAIKGALWYQGESNAERHQEYQKLLTALINDWRLKRGQGDFPFIIAQLPNFMEAKEQPSESTWASFRNAQLRTAQTVENVAITVNIDLGEWNDIHPVNKEDVGNRLALAAQKVAYMEKKLVSSGPVYESMKIKGSQIELSFGSCGSGLMSIDGMPLKHFAIAGADRRFVCATAEIRGNKVIVYCDNVAHPKIVRYAWSDNPEGANLQNQEGLPASPFTTENQ